MKMKVVARFAFLVNTVLFATYYAVAKEAMGRIDPVVFTFFEMTTLAPLALGILTFTSQQVTWALIKRGMVLGSCLCLALFTIAIALNYSTATGTAFFPALNGFLAALIAWLVLRQPMKKATWFAGLLSVAGTVLLIANSGMGGIRGAAIAFLGGLFFTLYVFLSDHGSKEWEKQKSLTHWSLLSVELLTMALWASLVALLFGNWQAFHPSFPKDGLIILYVAFACTFLPTLIAVYMQKYISAVTISFIYILEPVLGVVVAYFYLHEVLPLAGYLGGGLVVAGAFVHTCGSLERAEHHIQEVVLKQPVHMYSSSHEENMYDTRQVWQEETSTTSLCAPTPTTSQLHSSVIKGPINTPRRENAVEHMSLPVQSSPLDAVTDTLYPRIPSSRYAALGVLAQHTAPSQSSIRAQDSARFVAVQEPVSMPPVQYAGAPPSPRDARYYDADIIEEFTEYAPLLDVFDDEAGAEETLEEHPQLRLIVGIGSHPGIVRKNGVNEDNVLGVQDTYVTETGVVPVGLFVVADGMGGHSHGQEASRLAVCSVSEVVTPMVLNAKAEDTLCEEVLEDGIQRANTAIYQHNQQKFMMGTTITTALVFGSTTYVANVGDSRTYLYRATDGLTQITSDHSHVWQLFKEGCIQYEDIYTHPKRNEIYRCLGESARVEIDTFRVTLQANDVLLLCTDGLWEMVRDAEIEHIIQDNALHASQMSAKLIEAALHNGGADNVSVIVVSVDAAQHH